LFSPSSLGIATVLPSARRTVPEGQRNAVVLEKIRRLARPIARRLRLPNWSGWCPICEAPARFYALGDWYRDQLRCDGCGSIPRERALMAVIAEHFPKWRELKIHESSPGKRGVSRKLQAECPGYVASQYDTSLPAGARHPDGYLCENLESQTFLDHAFDLVVTQDVFEHVFRPDLAIREIGRTLKPGGAYVMTAPLVNKAHASRRRASLDHGEVVHHEEPQFHGNPIDPNGSLVTVDWGYDIAEFLTQHSGMPTTLFSFDDLSRGLRAEYLEVIVSWKRQAPLL